MANSFREIALRPVCEADLPFLFRLLCDPARNHLWMSSRRTLDEQEFLAAWGSWMANQMAARFLVEASGQPAGLVYDEGRCVEDGHTSVTLLLREQDTGRGVGVIAYALFVDWLFGNLPLNKVYFAVFGFNTAVIKMLRKLGLDEEGCFRQHRFWNGTTWAQHFFALYREAWPEQRARLLRVPRSRASPQHDDGAVGPASRAGPAAAWLAAPTGRNGRLGGSD
jgi:RimJ/RimL family protein N-acetyltransferase